MKKENNPEFAKFIRAIIISACIFIILNLITLYCFYNNTVIYILLFFIYCGALVLFITFYFVKIIKQPLDLITSAINTNTISLLADIEPESSINKIGFFLFNNYTQKRELQTAKEKAEESELLKASFLTNLSHEIRTPMNAILGFSDLLSTEKLSESEKKEFIIIIKRSGKNLVCIIDDLIEMSKIDTNQVKPNYAGFNLDEVLRDIKQTIEITITKGKPLQLFLDEPKHPVVYQFVSDETKFRQVLVNLINNAIKYTEKGSVNFGYKINPTDNTLEFYIKDTGIGISKEEFNNIFSRFNRIQNDKTINLSGLGLGLAISKAYIEMLEGRIWLKSAKNEGTTFSFTLPLKLNGLPAKKIEETKLNAIDKVKPLNILIAEDDSINFMLIKRVMDIRNYNVIRAKNGEEAVEICKTNNTIQLVIMDIKMPVMDGFEARKIIKEFKPYLPIIAHTAYTSVEINSKVYDAGFIDCVNKPLDKTKLFKIIDRIEHLTPDIVLN